MITQSKIEALNPCQNRLDNYRKFYSEKKFRKTQFMGLKNITHDDKLWVAFRMMTREQCVGAAADIAETVLSIYESKYPNDSRPREAVEAAREYAKNPTEKNRDAYAAAAANAAAYAATATANAANAANAAAANAAAYAAAANAYATANAANAAAYAATATAYAAAAAANAAAAAANAARPKQEKLIRKIVLKWWK